jgi:hypothetical protein
MPPRGRSPQARAQDVLRRIEENGGVNQLPDVLGSREVRPLMGVTWFGDALRLGVLPGVQIERGGVWRCNRETFIAWLQEVADGTAANMALRTERSKALSRDE